MYGVRLGFVSVTYSSVVQTLQRLSPKRRFSARIRRKGYHVWHWRYLTQTETGESFLGFRILSSHDVVSRVWNSCAEIWVRFSLLPSFLFCLWHLLTLSNRRRCICRLCCTRHRQTQVTHQLGSMYAIDGEYAWGAFPALLSV